VALFQPALDVAGELPRFFAFLARNAAVPSADPHMLAMWVNQFGS